MFLDEVRMAAGFMQWLSFGFTVGVADAAAFICSPTNSGPTSSVRGKAPPAAGVSIAFWREVLTICDPMSPFVASFCLDGL
jgi:hypothetical protein